MAFVYILFSKSLNKFYIGSTSLDLHTRIHQHNNKHYKNSFTASGIPWVLYDSIACDSVGQARAIERHIKRMKSKNFIVNLKSKPNYKNSLKSRF